MRKAIAGYLWCTSPRRNVHGVLRPDQFPTQPTQYLATRLVAALPVCEQADNLPGPTLQCSGRTTMLLLLTTAGAGAAAAAAGAAGSSGPRLPSLPVLAVGTAPHRTAPHRTVPMCAGACPCACGALAKRKPAIAGVEASWGTSSATVRHRHATAARPLARQPEARPHPPTHPPTCTHPPTQTSFMHVCARVSTHLTRLAARPGPLATGAASPAAHPGARRGACA